MVELDGRVLPTQVTGTFTELLGGQPMSFTACPAARVAAGANQVVEPATDPFDVQDVVLHRRGAASGAGERDAGRRGARPRSRGRHGGRDPVLDPGPAGPDGRRA